MKYAACQACDSTCILTVPAGEDPDACRICLQDTLKYVSQQEWNQLRSDAKEAPINLLSRLSEEEEVQKAKQREGSEAYLLQAEIECDAYYEKLHEEQMLNQIKESGDIED